MVIALFVYGDFFSPRVDGPVIFTSLPADLRQCSTCFCWFFFYFKTRLIPDYARHVSGVYRTIVLFATIETTVGK